MNSFGDIVHRMGSRPREAAKVPEVQIPKYWNDIFSALIC
jgi:hypothetical protein